MALFSITKIEEIDKHFRIFLSAYIIIPGLQIAIKIANIISNQVVRIYLWRKFCRINAVAITKCPLLKLINLFQVTRLYEHLNITLI